VTAQLERAARFGAQDSPAHKADKLRRLLTQAGQVPADDLAVLAALLSLPGGERLSEIEPDPERRKGRIFAALLRHLERLAAQLPVVAVFEDVHWSDPSTVGLLERLVDWVPSQRVLLVATCRPEFVSPWTGLAQSTLMALSRMTASTTTELVVSVAGEKRLPDAVTREIVLKTDGIPLFVEELTRAVIESGMPDRAEDTSVARAGAALAVPATLHDLLMARLDRLAKGREVGADRRRHWPYVRLRSAVDCGGSRWGGAACRAGATRAGGPRPSARQPAQLELQLQAHARP
jgi:predicted ATPase